MRPETHPEINTERLVELRLRRKWTKTKLAKLCGVSLPTISLIESGKRAPSTKTLRAIETALRVRAGALLV